MQITNNSLTIVWLDGAFAICDEKTGKRYQTESLYDGYTVSEAETAENCICYTLDTPEVKGIRCTLTFTEEGDGKLILAAPIDAKFDGDILYPTAFISEESDIVLLPISGGYAFPVNDPDILVNPVRPLYHGWNSSMPFWAIQREEDWVMAIADCGYDAVLYHDRDEKGLLRSKIGWSPEHLMWGYDRSLTFKIGSDGVSGVGKRYRRYAEKKGLVVTFKEKLKKKPNLKKFVGAVDFWLFDDHMNDDFRPEPLPDRKPNPLDHERVAKEMKELGMDRVLWGMGNRLDPSVIAKFQDEYGYLVGRYDNFRDVMPPDLELGGASVNYASFMGHAARWPQDIIIDKDGNYQNCWEMLGADGKMHPMNAMCDMAATGEAIRTIPDDVEKKGYQARFVDTIFAIPLEECYNPRHPMTRHECVKYRTATMGVVSDLGLVCGVEDGMEDAVPVVDYSEGMMSNGYYRCEDCGRRMDTLYFGKQIEPQVMKYLMDCRYRVPLWELVYHDCMASYWYWGESSNCCPEHIVRRDLLDNLYGAAPLYSVNMTQWDGMKDLLVESYNRTVPLATEVGFKEMTSFRYLSEDKLVQESVFEDVHVVVNFKDTDYVLEDGKIVKALDKIVY